MATIVNSSGHNFDTSFDLSDYTDSILEMLNDPENEGKLNYDKLRSDLAYYGFDNNTGSTWIYPTNREIRNYQMSITKAALFNNTLVALPTGLGKTFIAAVVMYNIYRWYPSGKIIFMAPTRPLVAQQIDACYEIMAIPEEDTIEITGKQQRMRRTVAWKSKRVFFATPQTVQSDILSPEHEFPITSIRLVVVDEAHKARGNYAYVKVIQMIHERNHNFRVLALSATPGRNCSAVAEVVRNLLISHLEVRNESSIDVAPYTHKKRVKQEVVPLGDRIGRIREELHQIIDPILRVLQDAGQLTGSIGGLGKFRIIEAHKTFNQLAAIDRPRNYSDLQTAFSTLCSLYHSLEMLEAHGIRQFLNTMHDPHSNNYKYFVLSNARLRALITSLEAEYGVGAGLDTSGALDALVVKHDFDFGHPKFEILRGHLQRHFEEHAESRAIVFTEYRDTVFLIDKMLAQCRPLVRARKLVGQGSSSGIKAVTQKEQISIMKEFKAGKTCNTLVATCVAEEGIDVGEVDLIICFDISTGNPTRFVQRMGRTGRKRDGRVIFLSSQGREAERCRQANSNKDKTNSKLSSSWEVKNVLYQASPRLVPPEFQPECLRICIKVPPRASAALPPPGRRKKRRALEPTEEAEGGDEAPAETSTPVAKKPRRAPKAAKKETGMRDMRTFFKPVELDEEAREVFEAEPACSPQEMIETVGRADQLLEEIDDPALRRLNELGEMLREEDAMEKRDLETILDDNCVPLAAKEVILAPGPEVEDSGRQEDELKSLLETPLDDQFPLERIKADFERIRQRARERKAAERDRSAMEMAKKDSMPPLNTMDWVSSQPFCPQFIEIESRYANKDESAVVKSDSLDRLNGKFFAFSPSPERSRMKTPSPSPPPSPSTSRFVQPNFLPHSPSPERKWPSPEPVEESPKMEKSYPAIDEMERSLCKTFHLNSIDDIFGDDDDDWFSSEMQKSSTAVVKNTHLAPPAAKPVTPKTQTTLTQLFRATVTPPARTQAPLAAKTPTSSEPSTPDGLIPQSFDLNDVFAADEAALPPPKATTSPALFANKPLFSHLNHSAKRAETSPLTQLHAPAKAKRARVIASDVSDSDREITCLDTPPTSRPRVKRRRHRQNAFLDLEAGVSGDEGDSEDDGVVGPTQAEFLDSIIALEDEPDAPDVNMFAKYVQTTRSPAVRRQVPQRIFDPAEIYSQAVVYDTQLDADLDSSFVVHDEVDHEMAEEEEDELERAERIIKERKRENRRRRRLIA